MQRPCTAVPLVTFLKKNHHARRDDVQGLFLALLKVDFTFFIPS